MDMDDLTTRFEFHPATSSTGPKHQEVRELCLALAVNLNQIIADGREKSLAMTHLEEVMYWSNAAIARRGD